MSRTDKGFLVLCVTIVAIAAGVWAWVLEDINQRKEQAIQAPMEYVEIGNGIQRTDDLEKGVSCYVKNNRLSCVKTAP
jgi:hypothetical protein